MFGVKQEYVDEALNNLGGQIKQLAEKNNALVDKVIALKSSKAIEDVEKDLLILIKDNITKEELAKVVADFVFRTNEMKGIMSRTLALLEKLVHTEPPKPKTPVEIVQDIKADFQNASAEVVMPLKETEEIKPVFPVKEYFGYCLKCATRKKMKDAVIEKNGIIRGACEACGTALITR